MALIKVIRHGYVFWEAPRCPNPPLPELEEPKYRSRASRIAALPTQYRRRQKPAANEPNITVLPSTPEDITNIQNAVIDAFEVSREEFFGRSRTEKVANARLASMALCRAYTMRTVEEIGEAHNRHHRVVCHASYRFIELQNDPAFLAAVARVESGLLQKAA